MKRTVIEVSLLLASCVLFMAAVLAVRWIAALIPAGDCRPHQATRVNGTGVQTAARPISIPRD